MPKNQQATTVVDDVQVVEVTSATTEVAEYSPLVQAMQDLETRYKDVVFDCSTNKGYEEAKVARAEIREVRYTLKKTEDVVLVTYRNAVKTAQARVNEVKQYGDDLRTKVLALEDPIDAKIKAKEKADDDEKARLKEIERVRVEAIQNKLTSFRSVASAYAARNSEDIASMLDRVKASVIHPEEYGEFEGEATIARETAIDSLQALHGLAVTREETDAKAKKDAADLEELRQRQKRLDDEAAEQRRIQAKRDQDELDRQREELKAAQKKLDDQAEQNRRDQEELARLRAQTTEPVKAASDTVPSQAASTAAIETAPTGMQEVHEARPAAEVADAQFDITMAEIIDVVGLSFDLSNDEAEAVIRRLFA